MAWLNSLRHPGKHIRTILKWSFLGVLIGCIGGVLGAVFHHALHFVTHLRGTHTWLIFLLPVGGLMTVGLYQLFRMSNNRGTNEIVDAILSGKPANPLVAPAIFLSTIITHLFGGSAGREGAALQLGGSVASFLAKWMKLAENERSVLIMSGMSAVFAGLFCTPLTACLFAMEFESIGTIFSPALLPCYIAAFVATQISSLFGVHAKAYILDDLVSLTAWNAWKFILLAVLISLLGIAMCYIFHHMEHLAQKWMPRPYLRIVFGAVVVILLTVLVGDQRYNGAGMEMALEAIGGHAEWYSFLLKLLFTAITLAAGFKGGEIVPTFCIGATFGCLCGEILGIDPGIAAALGLVGLFCCATNSPLTSIILSIEMFGDTNLYLFSLICVITFVLSGNSGLYMSQIVQFSRMPTAGNSAFSLRNHSRTNPESEWTQSDAADHE